jgi:FAD/FMN-containing dehydrogenase
MRSSPISQPLEIDLAPLRSAVGGDITGPGDDGYDGARGAWNLVADQRPAVVVHAASTDDVAAVIRFAAENGLKVAPQATGHGAVALPPLGDAILLRTERLAGVTIDPAARTARVEPGAKWGAVADAAGEHGLVGLGGSSPTVGVTGYTLGGGLGWLAREHGLAANRVIAAELVTGTGEHVRVDAERDPELFWALRGGGGPGVVTALEFALLPLATSYAGSIAFDAEHAPAVFAGFMEWAATAPRAATAMIRFLTLPPIPDVPEPLRGRPLVDITLAYAGGAAEGEPLVAPLRALAPLVYDRFGEIRAADLCRMAGDPEDPVPGLGAHAMLGALDDDAVAAFIAAAGPDSGSPLVAAGLRHLGGALAEAPEGSGALGALDGDWALFMVGVPMTPELGEAIRAHQGRVIDALAPARKEHVYANLQDPPAPASALFDEPTLERLRAVRDRIDPDGVVIAKHPVD